jgi:hypothetical protein
MDLSAKNLSVKESKEYLELNGVTFSEIWIRTLIMHGSLKSKKIFSSRVIPRTELDKIIRDRKAHR